MATDLDPPEFGRPALAASTIAVASQSARVELNRRVATSRSGRSKDWLAVCIGELTKGLVAVTRNAGVRVQGGLAAEVGVEDVGGAGDLAAADEVDQARHRLPLVDGVDDHALKLAAEPDRVDG